LGGQPGATVTLFVVAGNETGKAMNVPVLDGTLAEYSELFKQIGGVMPSVEPTASAEPTE
jgi:hypothetical protein